MSLHVRLVFAGQRSAIEWHGGPVLMYQIVHNIAQSVRRVSFCWIAI